LKRIGKNLNRWGRLRAYYSFILSNFNYCPVTWHYCSVSASQRVEGQYDNTFTSCLQTNGIRLCICQSEGRRSVW
jgi:hypothetical protein